MEVAPVEEISPAVGLVAAVAVPVSNVNGLGIADQQSSIHQRELPPDIGPKMPPFWNSCVNVEYVKSMYYHDLSTTVAGRLSRYAHRWEALGASPAIVSKLKYGLALRWLDKPPPLAYSPLVESGYSDAVRDGLLADAVAQMLLKGVIEPIPQPKKYAAFTAVYFWFQRRTGNGVL